MIEPKYNDFIVEDLLRLRDELARDAFGENGAVLKSTEASICYKINSVLYKGYPRRGKTND
jgi:hypothetical protein